MKRYLLLILIYHPLNGEVIDLLWRDEATYEACEARLLLELTHLQKESSVRRDDRRLTGDCREVILPASGLVPGLKP